ncbi:hypothetical protein [Pseudomonas phage COT4]|uniref:Tail protein n=1 Tax=Pseudomonas phage M5.1 TaxID=2873460 RepID=A0AAE9BPE3_9CAUD|nr:tail protein [Pseudomonas phage M5.1]UAV89674.1 tail protein [Pseudomonas phage M5.1]UGL61274.1 hypothetical protein [Pseudomonas phage COT4]
MIVLRRANGDIIWFDAVTNYDQTYSATVTKHPIATGGYVSDHTTTDNVILQINAVLSDADFNLQRSLIEVKSANGTDVAKDKQFTNNTQVVYPVTISEKTTINKLLPEVIAQFTKDTIPDAYVTPQNKIKTALAVKLDMISMWRNREEFQILDIIDNTVVEQFSPCIFTNLTFREDETTGEGVFPNMTIEQVTFTDLQEVAVKIKTANKGRKSGTTTKKPTETPPDNAPTEETKKDASAGRQTQNNTTSAGSS